MSVNDESEISNIIWFPFEKDNGGFISAILWLPTPELVKVNATPTFTSYAYWQSCILSGFCFRI